MITGSLNYAPLEEVIPVQKRAEQVVPKKENTECNMVVMIFIGSVLFLALMDSVK
jgi:hypothetical protein